MLKNHLFILGIFFCSSLAGQTFSKSMIVCDKSYTVKSELKPDNAINMTITDDNDETKKKDYSVKTRDIDLFSSSFKINFLSKFSADCDATHADQLQGFARNFFLGMIAANTQDTSQPTAGTMKIYDSIYIYYRYTYKNGDSSFIIDAKGDWAKFKIIKADIEINNGFIMNMKAYVEYADKTIHYFILPYPTGISSVGNFKRFTKTKLIELNSKIPEQNVINIAGSKLSAKLSSVNNIQSYKKVDSGYYILLGDLMDYDNQLGLDRRDYSPEPQEIIIKGGDAVILHKEKTNRLFEANMFTDFVGLQEEKPNGLVQVEVKKNININTTQRLTKPWIYWLFRSYGWFHHIEPSVSFSKIEQHNRNLILGDLDSVRLNPPAGSSSFNENIHRYATNLSLYQQQWFSAGFNLNIFTMNNHDAKYDFSINGGARLGITPVLDSLTSIKDNTISRTGFTKEYSVNSLQFFPELMLRFLPEERFSLILSNRFIYFKPLNGTVQGMATNKTNNLLLKPVSASWLNSAEILMTIQVNENSKLFGRVRFTNELSNMKNNFAQVQVGYSTFILGNK